MLFGALALAACEESTGAVSEDGDTDNGVENLRSAESSDLTDGQVADEEESESDGSSCETEEVEDNDVAATESFVEEYEGLEMKMLYVAGGEFRMGATEEQTDKALDDEKPVRTVTLDDFYIGECEVTQLQWEKVMGTTLDEQRAGTNVEGSEAHGVGDDYPMYYVSWDDAAAFCEKLTLLTGRKYCLPSEAQWEYAARGGQKSKGFKYSGSNRLGEVAWYSVNTMGYDYSAHPVKTKKANELGLYDMSGNVYEWCSDWYANRYNASDTVNPQGPQSGTLRVHRGGSWNYLDRDCRVSYRSYHKPDVRYDVVGFRVVCLCE